MSLLATALGLVAGPGSTPNGNGGGLLGSAVSFGRSLFGGSNPNMARGFSERSGLPCTVREDQKNLVLMMQGRGITPEQICKFTGSGIPTGTLGDVIGRKFPPGGFPGGVEQIFKEHVLPGVAGAITGTGPMSAMTRTGLGGAVRAVGGAMSKAPGAYYTATGRLSRVVLNTGKVMTVRDIARFVRFVGDIALAATILGISAQDAADALTRKRRARRGISGPQLASAKRVICTINRMSKELNCKPTTPRRRTCR